jgi:hypothetical protein
MNQNASSRYFIIEHNYYRSNILVLTKTFQINNYVLTNVKDNKYFISIRLSNFNMKPTTPVTSDNGTPVSNYLSKYCNINISYGYFDTRYIASSWVPIVTNAVTWYDNISINYCQINSGTLSPEGRFYINEMQINLY